jgi:hypothetical protein
MGMEILESGSSSMFNAIPTKEEQDRIRDVCGALADVPKQRMRMKLCARGCTP